MFRNELGNVSLSGRRPPFRPAVEALEERLVLDSSESLAPSNHGPTTPVDFYAQGLLQALVGLQNTLLAREQNGPPIKLSLLKNLRTIQNGLRHQLVNLIPLADTANDPYFVQAATQFNDVDQALQAEWQGAREIANSRANQKLGQAVGNLGGQVAQKVLLQQAENQLLQWGNQLAQQAQQFLSGQQQ